MCACLACRCRGLADTRFICASQYVCLELFASRTNRENATENCPMKEEEEGKRSEKDKEEEEVIVKAEEKTSRQPTCKQHYTVSMPGGMGRVRRGRA